MVNSGSAAAEVQEQKSQQSCVQRLYNTKKLDKRWRRKMAAISRSPWAEPPSSQTFSFSTFFFNHIEQKPTKKLFAQQNIQTESPQLLLLLNFLISNYTTNHSSPHFTSSPSFHPTKTMAKTLRIVRISLVTLQLISLTVAAVILVVHYNPWIERIIEEAEKTTTGNGSQGSQNGSPPAPDEVVSQLGHSLAEQINRVEGEEIVLFLMSAATILVSLLGIVGTLRGSLSPATSKVHHQHNCLLNFYMSTLIVFLFVIFMALCGTLWEVISKLQAASHGSSGTSVGVHLSGTVVASTANPFESAYDLVVEGDEDNSNSTAIEGKVLMKFLTRFWTKNAIFT